MRKRTVAAATVGALVVLALLIAGTVLFVTQTDWGRKKVGGYVIGLIKQAAHGYVTVDRVDGNLLNGATIVGLTITDSARAPFVKADTVVATYGIGDLINKRIYLDNVRIVHPVIVLNRMPGGKWNYDRIFPRDTLKGTKRDSVIRFTLSPLARLNVQRVAGGFQKTSQFRNIYGTFPLMRLEDPNDRRQIIDVSSLRMTAEPLRPPSVRVTDVKGRFILLADSLYFHGIDATLASSRLSNGTGRYNFDSNDLRLRLHA